MAQMLAQAGEYASEHPWTTLAALSGGFVIWRALDLYKKWQYRKVPGTYGLPLLGDLPSMISEDLTRFTDRMYKKYKGHPVFKNWFGSNANIIIRDTELCRRILMSQKSRYPLDILSFKTGFDYKVWSSISLFTTGPLWQLGRRATEASLMHPKALQIQGGNVAVCVSRLMETLDRYAKTGEPLDMQICTYAMALDAVGFAGFGIDLHASPVKNPGQSVFGAEGVDSDSFVPAEGWWSQHPVGSAEFGECMVRCAVYFMRATEQKRASAYTALAAMFSSIKPVWDALSQIFPDRALVRERLAMRGLQQGSKIIMDTWRTEKLAQQQQTANGKGPTTNNNHKPTLQVSDAGLISRVLSGEDFGPNDSMTDYEYLGLFITALVAGYDTTGTTTAMILWQLAQNPKAQTKAQQDIDTLTKGRTVTAEDLEQLPYIHGILQETLRLNEPATFAIREAKEDLDVGQGITLPKGSWLSIPLYSMNHDSDIWPRVDDFLPERHISDHPDYKDLTSRVPGAFMPFGAGMRMCVGYKFAELEAKLATARLLQQYTFLPVEGQEPKMQSGITYAPDKVMLRVTRRTPAKEVWGCKHSNTTVARSNH